MQVEMSKVKSNEALPPAPAKSMNLFPLPRETLPPSSLLGAHPLHFPSPALVRTLSSAVEATGGLIPWQILGSPVKGSAWVRLARSLGI